MKTLIKYSLSVTTLSVGSIKSLFFLYSNGNLPPFMVDIIDFLTNDYFSESKQNVKNLEENLSNLKNQIIEENNKPESDIKENTGISNKTIFISCLVLLGGLAFFYIYLNSGNSGNSGSGVELELLKQSTERIDQISTSIDSNLNNQKELHSSLYNFIKDTTNYFDKMVERGREDAAYNRNFQDQITTTFRQVNSNITDYYGMLRSTIFESASNQDRVAHTRVLERLDLILRALQGNGGTGEITSTDTNDRRRYF